jgi:hypothetical protein
MKRKIGERKGEKKFNDILLESIDKAFLTLGETSKSAIYFNLERKFALSRQDIPDRVCDFSDAIEQIFGLAARQLEILIMKCLNEKIECTYDWVGPKWLIPDLTFTKYVKLLELCFEEKKQNVEVEALLDAGEQKQEQRTL